jgi:hypothetical protein
VAAGAGAWLPRIRRFGTCRGWLVVTQCTASEHAKHPTSVSQGGAILVFPEHVRSKDRDGERSDAANAMMTASTIVQPQDGIEEATRMGPTGRPKFSGTNERRAPADPEVGLIRLTTGVWLTTLGRVGAMTAGLARTSATSCGPRRVPSGIRLFWLLGLRLGRRFLLPRFLPLAGAGLSRGG